MLCTLLARSIRIISLLIYSLAVLSDWVYFISLRRLTASQGLVELSCCILTNYWIWRSALNIECESQRFHKIAQKWWNCAYNDQIAPVRCIHSLMFSPKLQSLLIAALNNYYVIEKEKNSQPCFSDRKSDKTVVAVDKWSLKTGRK